MPLRHQWLVIDWTSEAKRTAIHEVEREEQEHRPATALAPPTSAMFGTKRVPAPSFHWYRAGTHGLESAAGGGPLVNLSDNCALVFFPYPLLGCTLEKSRARGDLFDHMRDMVALGAWKEH